MFISSALDYLGALPTSLSMIVIGASLTEIPLKELFTDKRLLAFSALKLLVIPIAGLMAVKPFVREQDLLAVVMVMLATPVASMVVMIAQQHDADYRTRSVQSAFPGSPCTRQPPRRYRSCRHKAYIFRGR